MALELALELIETPDETAWAVVEAGPWSWLKVRRRLDINWSRAYRALRHNTERPGLIARSDSEVADYVELKRVRQDLVLPSRSAGFQRAIVASSSEPNNAEGWDLARWQRESPNYIGQWLAFTAAHPDVAVCSPPMGVDSPAVLAPWHVGLDVFELKGAHCYANWPTLFWEPSHVRSLIGEPVVVLEFNQADRYQSDRLAANIATLEQILTNYPELSLVTFFCAPNHNPRFVQMSVTIEDAKAYGAWLKERSMPEYDPQAVMDYWFSQPWQPAQGYNENDAFGSYIAQHGDLRLGAQKCPDLELGSYLFRFYACGILYAKVGDWLNVSVAYGIQGLPPKV